MHPSCTLTSRGGTERVEDRKTSSKRANDLPLQEETQAPKAPFDTRSSETNTRACSMYKLVGHANCSR
jgi:hypothetical protein